MSWTPIVIGNAPNDGTGTNWRECWNRVNSYNAEQEALRSRTISAGDIRFADQPTTEAKITAAIAQAVVELAGRVYVPAFMLPYNASLVSFNNAIQMVREGGDNASFDVRAYGAAGNYTQDDTESVRATVAAVAVAGSLGYVGGKVYFPKGTYKITAPVVINTSYVQLWGDVQHGVTIYFVPTANGACFQFDASGATLWNCGIKRLRFASNDTTYKKTMVKVVDCRAFQVEDIISADGEWTGNGSIGLHYCGRDLLSVRDSWFAADQPMKVSVNPNFAANAMDFAVFEHTQFAVQAGISNYNIEIDDGVAWSRNVWRDCDGARGLGFIRWNDTTSTSPSFSNCFEGAAQEQSIAGSTYAFDLQSTVQQLQETVFNRVSSGNTTGINGIKLRKAFDTKIGSFVQVGGDALNMDSTCRGLDARIWLPSGETTTGLSGVVGDVRITNPQIGNVSGDRGDVNVTLVALVDSPTQRVTSSLTADRTWTLSATNAHRGAKFRIVRTGLGAGQLIVTGIKTIPAATAAFIDVEHDGSGWKFTGYGLL